MCKSVAAGGESVRRFASRNCSHQLATSRLEEITLSWVIYCYLIEAPIVLPAERRPASEFGARRRALRRITATNRQQVECWPTKDLSLAIGRVGRRTLARLEPGQVISHLASQQINHIPAPNRFIGLIGHCGAGRGSRSINFHNLRSKWEKQRAKQREIRNPSGRAEDLSGGSGKECARFVGKVLRWKYWTTLCNKTEPLKWPAEGAQ